MGVVDRREGWRALVTSEVLERQLGALWGKSAERAGGQMNLLLQHLFDTMGVAELIWSEFLAPVIRHRLDQIAGGEGQRLYVWLCGLHDVGKASPAFQRQVKSLATAVRAAGLGWPDRPPRTGETWRHDRASACTLLTVLQAGWPDGGDQLDWIWPMAAGHHGTFPSLDEVTIRSQRRERARMLQGDQLWRPIQELLVLIVTSAVGWRDLAAAKPALVPSRADQLAVSGFVTMADWIASDERHFVGISDLRKVGAADACLRATNAWRSLGLRGGWGSDLQVRPFVERFGRAPRPSQQMVIDAAEELTAPGLLVIEAPTGEGKTEAALSAAETLAARFGADGIYVALPTQATSDAMYERVRLWLGTFHPRPAVALLHGRRLLSERARRSPDDVDGKTEEDEVDAYGMPDEPPTFSSVCEDDADEVDRPAAWFLGSRRGLLTANGVGTIDQVLYAGARTKYVALRYAGLAGKVVIIDEVHAADTYMAQFLVEVLWWLGNGRVPVVLLSATLPPAQREELMRAYLEGYTVATRTALPALPEVSGYPRVVSACIDSAVRYQCRSASTWREDLRVVVDVVEEQEGVAPYAETVLRWAEGGGCLLVIHNTVSRAQDTYRSLAPLLGREVVLLHSRFTSSTRARLTEQLLGALGEDGRSRPARLVVVATQVAEQSFDIDADLVISDLAPVDLLLQRAGRLHRHARPTSERPRQLQTPRLVVGGMRRGGGAPWFPAGSESVYGRYPLLRSAALVLRAAATGGWSLPLRMPELVAEAYGAGVGVPESWAGDTRRAHERWADEVQSRRSKASTFRLASPINRFEPTLAGLHRLAHPEAERSVRVRDGETGEEVILVCEEEGGWRTVDGLRLGPQGDVGRDRPEEVLGASLRFPSSQPDLDRVVRELDGLPGWRDDPWLGEARALRLDREGRTQLCGRELEYDPQLGLLITRPGGR